MIIDVFCHFYTEEYLQALKEFCPAIRFVGPDATTGRMYITDSQVNRGVDIGFLRMGTGFEDISRRLRDMSDYGVEMQAISIGGPGIDSQLLHVSPEVTVKLAKIINNSISKVAEKFPDKFLAVGEVPISSPNEAIDEINRAVRDLGIKAVQLYTTADGKPIDSPLYRPVFEKIAKLDIPILIHPTYPRPEERRNYESDYELQMIYVWPFETTLSASRLVFSGILEEYPTLKFVTHHAGAMIPFFMERIESVYAQARKGGLREQAKIRKDPKEYFKMMYHDTAIYGSVAALNCAADVFGIDRLIYATDYPFGPEDGCYFLRVTKDSVKQMRATEAQKEQIFSENAKKLFKIS